jgi:hypothetical protein
MKKCVSGKRLYPSRQLAEEALIESHIHFEHRAGGGPVAVYQCEECGEFHLTSRGPMNERLDKQLTDGTIKRLKEAARWQNRFKR